MDNKVRAPIRKGIIFEEINPPIKTNVKCPYCEKMMGIFYQDDKMEIMRCEDHPAWSGFIRARESEKSIVHHPTRASRNAVGSKKSRPALRKARNVARNTGATNL
jgi:ssDNA-binding Zn-finger/Zn-ribbon topoisomerase 1